MAKTLPSFELAGATDGVTPTSTVTGLYLVKSEKAQDGTEVFLNKDWTSEGTQENQNVTNFTDVGKLKSLINSYGYSTDGTPTGAVKGVLPDMLANLNKMAKAFATEFNNLHKSGTDLKGNLGLDFFVKDNATDTDITAANISVAQINYQ